MRIAALFSAVFLSGSALFVETGVTDASAEETRPYEPSANHTSATAELTSEKHRKYAMAIQVWQDSALLAAPRLTVFENELSEIIVSEPDTLKISFRLKPSADKKDEILVESEIYLPQSGTWESAATPRIVTSKGQRASMEYSIADRGFTHVDGRQVEILRLQVLVDDPQ